MTTIRIFKQTIDWEKSGHDVNLSLGLRRTEILRMTTILSRKSKVFKLQANALPLVYKDSP